MTNNSSIHTEIVSITPNTAINSSVETETFEKTIIVPGLFNDLAGDSTTTLFISQHNSTSDKKIESPTKEISYTLNDNTEKLSTETLIIESYTSVSDDPEKITMTKKSSLIRNLSNSQPSNLEDTTSQYLTNKQTTNNIINDNIFVSTSEGIVNTGNSTSQNEFSSTTDIEEILRTSKPLDTSEQPEKLTKFRTSDSSQKITEPELTETVRSTEPQTLYDSTTINGKRPTTFYSTTTADTLLKSSQTVTIDSSSTSTNTFSSTISSSTYTTTTETTVGTNIKDSTTSFTQLNSIGTTDGYSTKYMTNTTTNSDISSQTSAVQTSTKSETVQTSTKSETTLSTKSDTIIPTNSETTISTKSDTTNLTNSPTTSSINSSPTISTSSSTSTSSSATPTTTDELCYANNSYIIPDISLGVTELPNGNIWTLNGGILSIFGIGTTTLYGFAISEKYVIIPMFQTTEIFDETTQFSYTLPGCDEKQTVENSNWYHVDELAASIVELETGYESLQPSDFDVEPNTGYLFVLGGSTIEETVIRVDDATTDSREDSEFTINNGDICSLMNEWNSGLVFILHSNKDGKINRIITDFVMDGPNSCNLYGENYENYMGIVEGLK
ncbi:hypothetical protein SNEBB_011459 [Seison nebaliae]|nr:hypothetical protein SNEBB_011459 [Seison nebaliae]